MRGLKIYTLAQPGRITATTNGAAVDLKGLDGKGKLHMRSTGTEGAGQTMDIKIQHSADGATNWTDATLPISGAAMAFPQIVNAATAGQTLELNIADLHRYVRAVQTMGGTTPAGAAYVCLVAKARRI